MAGSGVRSLLRRRSALVVPAAAAVSLVGASASRAAVSIGATRITVASKRAVAVVTRNPFRLVVQTEAGRPALSEVPNGRPGPSVLSPTVDPIPPGTDARVSGQLYAPLSYLVGTESVTQYSGSVWGGNPQTGVRSGIQYAARAVRGAKRLGPPLASRCPPMTPAVAR